MRVVTFVVIATSLAGCAAPVQTQGGDRAVALYREGLGPVASPAAGAGGGELPEGHLPPSAARTPESLTADEAVAMAKAGSARLAYLKALADGAAAKVDAARRIRNPELRISQLQLDEILDDKTQERTSLRVAVPRPGEIEARAARARAEQAEARAALQAEEAAIEGDIRWRFDNVALLDTQVAAMEAVASARAALAAQIRARLEASEANALEDAMAELSAVDAEQDRAELVAERDAAKAELLARIGLDPAARVRIAGDRPDGWPLPPLPDEQTVIEAALRSRPEIQIAAAKIDASEARASAERFRRWPWFSFLELGYQVGPKIPDGLGWTFQAGIELPIFDTHGAGVTAAEAAQTAAKRGFAAEVARITLEVRASLRRARDAAALVAELRKRALPATERAATAVRRAIEGQQVDIVRALTVDERRVLMELRVVMAIRRYRAAVADLRRVAGGHLPAGRSSGAAPAVQTPSSGDSPRER